MTDTIFANFGDSQEWVLAGRLLLWQNQQHDFPPQSRPPTPEQLRVLAAQWAVDPEPASLLDGQMRASSADSTRANSLTSGLHNRPDVRLFLRIELREASIIRPSLKGRKLQLFKPNLAATATECPR